MILVTLVQMSQKALRNLILCNMSKKNLKCGDCTQLQRSVIQREAHDLRRVNLERISMLHKRCGFAQSQAAYEVAVKNLFSTLDHLDEHLSKSRYLCGDILTLADIRLFTTLFRFDAAYHVLFKCSKKKISEYKNLYGYLQDMYQIPRVSSTCDLQAIMDGYYKVLFPLNPGGICPLAPTSSESSLLLMSHGREKMICNAFETIK